MKVNQAVSLLRPLGQGGMGRVWVAAHATLETEVVVKFMATEAAVHADAVTRFSREAALSAAVKSPHVVQMLDHGVTAGGTPYIVMEKLEGKDLADHLAAYGRMAPKDVASIVTQVAKALGRAHQAGVIHRDIKPENIFLCDGEGGEMFVKVLDFGIAKAQMTVGSSTTTGSVVGTPYYMSPEQIVGEREIDGRTDIWSLGVVVFESLTGVKPFEGSTIGAITLALHSATPRITAHANWLPPTFDEWFAKACARDPQARFASAREAAQAFEKFGDALLMKGDLATALDAYRRSLAFREQMTKDDNPDSQRDVATSYSKLSIVYSRMNDRDGALTALQKGRDIMEQLVKRAPDNTDWTKDLTWFNNQIASLKK